MAKLKGPLFSLRASGQLGKALVFFGWKGLNVVRSHVVPSNPRTAGQVTQRGYLTDAVTAIHQTQSTAPNPLDAEDISAYALKGSTFATPRTWFNQAVKSVVDQLVAGLDWLIFRDGHLTPGANQLTMTIFNSRSGVAPAACNIAFGTSKTALIHLQATTAALLAAGVVIPGLVTGTKYYAQIRQTAPPAYVGNRSGIYYGVPT